MDWMTVRSAGKCFEFHVIGTGLLSALVWSGTLSFQKAVRTAVEVGISWDSRLTKMAEAEIRKTGVASTDENLGWLRFQRVRQLIEGRSSVSMAAELADFSELQDPQRPFWFSANAKSEPVWIETRKDVRAALETLNLASWSPEIPVAPKKDRIAGTVRGWLISPMHPNAAACRWSFHNYLLATPATAMLFLNHIASEGPSAAILQPRNVFNESSGATYRSART
jgi:hypothetical protein